MRVRSSLGHDPLLAVVEGDRILFAREQLFLLLEIVIPEINRPNLSFKFACAFRLAIFQTALGDVAPFDDVLQNALRCPRSPPLLLAIWLRIQASIYRLDVGVQLTEEPKLLALSLILLAKTTNADCAGLVLL